MGRKQPKSGGDTEKTKLLTTKDTRISKLKLRWKTLKEKASGIRDSWKASGGRKKLALAAVIAILAAAGAGMYYFTFGNRSGDTMGGVPEMGKLSEAVVTASGLTSTGMTEEEYELDFLETPLYVEESYLSIGDTVEAGTAVFKVSGDSLTEARETLGNEVTETDLAYRQGIIDYETGRLESESACRTADISKEYAQAQYESSLEEAQQTVSGLEKQVEEAEELYDEYTASVENDYYYTYYEIEELHNTYYDNFTFLMELYERWDIEGLYDQYPNGGSGSRTTGTSGGGQPTTGQSSVVQSTEELTDAQLSTGQSESTQLQSGQSDGVQGGKGGNALQGVSDDESKLTVYEMMEELVEENGEAYETAVEQYEKDKMMAAASLEQARSKLASLQAELEEAKLQYEKQVIVSRADYDTTEAESENAQTVYETELEKLEEELEALKDDKEDAEENLAVFESTVGDGYFYTQSAGTIVMNRIREESYLTAEDIILAYSDPQTVSVAASVGQSDIAKINVGDNAYVTVSGYGIYEGRVISVNPLSSSDSRSSVTYTVTVQLDGDIGGLESNLTAYVYLGLSDEQMQEAGAQEPQMGAETEEAGRTEAPENASGGKQP